MKGYKGYRFLESPARRAWIGFLSLPGIIWMDNDWRKRNE